MTDVLDQLKRRIKETDWPPTMAEVAALCDEAEQLREMTKRTVCAYCGTLVYYGDRTTEAWKSAMSMHIVQCKDRPEAVLIASVMAFRSALQNDIKASEFATVDAYRAALLDVIDPVADTVLAQAEK